MTRNVVRLHTAAQRERGRTVPVLTDASGWDGRARPENADDLPTVRPSGDGER